MKTNKTGSFSKWWKMLEPIAEIAAHKYHTPMTKPNYRQRKRREAQIALSPWFSSLIA